MTVPLSDLTAPSSNVSGGALLDEISANAPSSPSESGDTTGEGEGASEAVMDDSNRETMPDADKPGSSIQDDLTSPLPDAGAQSDDNFTDTLPDLVGVPSRSDIDRVRAECQCSEYEINGYIDRQRPQLLAQGLTNQQIDDYYGVERLDWSKVKQLLLPGSSPDAEDELAVPSFWEDLENKFHSTAAGALFFRDGQEPASSDAAAPMWQQVSTDMLAGAPDTAATLGTYKLGKAALEAWRVDRTVSMGVAAAGTGAVMAATRRILLYLTDIGYCEDPGAAQKLMLNLYRDTGMGALAGVATVAGFGASGKPLASLLDRAALSKSLLTAAEVAKGGVQGMSGAVTLALSQGHWISAKEVLEGGLYGASFLALEEGGENAQPGDNGTESSDEGENGESPVSGRATALSNMLQNSKNIYAQYGITPSQMVAAGMKDPSLFREMAGEDPDISSWFPEETAVAPGEPSDAGSSSDDIEEQSSSASAANDGDQPQDPVETPPDDNVPVDHSKHTVPEFREFAKSYPSTRSGLMQAIRGFLIKKGADGNEHVLVRDGDAVVHYETSGKADEVAISRPELLAAEGRNLTLYHNHNNGASTSLKDLNLLDHPNVKQVVALGPNGETSSIALTKVAADALDRLSKMSDPESFVKRADTLPDLRGELARSVNDSIDQSMGSGRIAQRPSRQFQAEIVNQALKNNGIIDYTPSRSLKHILKVEKIPKSEYNGLQSSANNDADFFLRSRNFF